MFCVYARRKNREFVETGFRIETFVFAIIVIRNTSSLKVTILLRVGDIRNRQGLENLGGLV